MESAYRAEVEELLEKLRAAEENAMEIMNELLNEYKTRSGKCS